MAGSVPGGMGEVFLGRSRGGRRGTVKVVRPYIADGPGFRARFRREVEAARCGLVGSCTARTLRSVYGVT